VYEERYPLAENDGLHRLVSATVAGG
jgi:hypothetical protein